jgi:hypothetical protein
MNTFQRIAQDPPEHPLASKLYRQFRAGSGALTKDEAWDIANELDAQLQHIQELQQKLAAALTAGAELSRNVRAVL